MALTSAYQQPRFIVGDAHVELARLPNASVDCCVTSPPYWNLRDYGASGQLGQEATPELYVAGLVRVFSEVTRVLRPTGSLWLVVGDSYYGGPPLVQPKDAKGVKRLTTLKKLCENESCDVEFVGRPTRRFCTSKCASHSSGQKRQGFDRPKCLLGLPWRLLSALVMDGWVLRNDVIWHKPNHLPSPASDRLACSFEHCFHLVQPGRWIGKKYDASYYYDASKMQGRDDVWSIPTVPGKTGHPAPFPEDLIEPMIAACTPLNGTVLDPFAGSGTTGRVATRLRRRSILIDLVNYQ